tara:strand:- start:317 stop:1222 length:906 start_codon:yes stop_codon:yes gene_type:complete
MSRKHPVIAITGSSGAGTSSVRVAFEHMFLREKINVAVIQGDSYHRFNRTEMKQTMQKAQDEGQAYFSHFGQEANLFGELQEAFRQYGEDGSGKWRLYLHNHEECEPYSELDLKPGEFTPWQDFEPKTDLLFYEGLHGCVVDKDIDMSPYIDLKIGVVPVINLEWIQKIHRDTSTRGYSEEAVMEAILRRMHDYVHIIIPQFQHTDINFQRVPVVDTSDPIIARDIPTPDESLVVIRFKDPAHFNVDFPYLLQMLDGSWMSRRNSIVVTGGKMGLAMELIMTPILQDIMEERRQLLKREAA